MTEFARPNRAFSHAPLAAAALALALLAGMIGAVAGGALDGLRQALGTPAAPAAAGLDPKWVAYGESWESRQRAMYPTALEPKWVEYGESWEQRQRAMYPDAEAKWVQYGQDWQRRYEQQHPTP